MYEDKELTCKDCGSQFVWTASEQQFYADKGFTNSPVRCPVCRKARKQRSDGGGRFAPRQMFSTVCAQCGKNCEVPFQPRGDKPVYCLDCFKSR